MINNNRNTLCNTERYIDITWQRCNIKHSSKVIYQQEIMFAEIPVYR